VTELFIAVFELEKEERQRKLDVLCKDCPELRAEVELLLSFHDGASSPP